MNSRLAVLVVRSPVPRLTERQGMKSAEWQRRRSWETGKEAVPSADRGARWPASAVVMDAGDGRPRESREGQSPRAVGIYTGPSGCTPCSLVRVAVFRCGSGR